MLIYRLFSFFLRRKFADNNLQLPPGLTLDALLDLITLCCESTIFTFNGRFYQQIFGVAMGFATRLHPRQHHDGVPGVD